MTTHSFHGIAFKNGQDGVTDLSNARITLAAVQGIDFFQFREEADDTWYDSSGLVLSGEVETPPDPLGNTEWVGLGSQPGFFVDHVSFRIQRVTWGEGQTAIVLTLELQDAAGEAVVALIRLRGNALPDPNDPAEAAAFLGSVQNAPVRGQGFDLGVPMPFAAVPGHRLMGEDDLFTPDQFGGSWENGVRCGVGNDTIYGQISDDRLFGGAGDDVLGGHWGANTLFGGTGNDLLLAHGGTIIGGTPDHPGCFLVGGTGNDTVKGSTIADDTILGGDGNDLLSAKGGEGYFGTQNGADVGDTIFGGHGRDTLNGADGRDSLFGGSGADSLTGGGNSDTLTGGSGADLFVFSQNSGVDAISDFDLLLDRLDMSDISTSIAVLSHAEGTLLDWGDGAVLLEGIRRSDFLEADLI